MIYFDNGATTYPKPECVYQALDRANRNAFNSGRGSYKVARESTKLIDEVRRKIMTINDIDNANVILFLESILLKEIIYTYHLLSIILLLDH